MDKHLPERATQGSTGRSISTNELSAANGYGFVHRNGPSVFPLFSMRDDMAEEQEKGAYRQECNNQYRGDINARFSLLRRFGLGYSNTPDKAVGYELS
jgi:hypothetical protein